MENTRLMPMDGYTCCDAQPELDPTSRCASKSLHSSKVTIINIMRVLHATVAVHRGRKARELPHALMPAIAHLPTDIR